MRDLTLNDGEILARAGELKTSVFVVLCGHVMMTADNTPGDSTSGDSGGSNSGQGVLAGPVFGPGSVFGFGNAANGPGLVTGLCAHGDVCLRICGESEARAAAQSGQDEDGPLLAAALRLAVPPTVTPANGIAVRLVATEPAIADRIGLTDLAIDVFPFVVGRQSGDASAAAISLPIRDRRPFQLSRRHFLIDRADGAVEVRDCGSNNGTIVNGTALGGKNTAFREALRPGENEIIAGTASSPFRFLCHIDKAALL